MPAEPSIDSISSGPPAISHTNLLTYGLKPGKMGRRGNYRPSDENSLNLLTRFSENEATKEVK